MSTRSIVGFPYGDGVKGRYCHSDGYPSHNGRVLWELVQRDGARQVMHTLTEEHYGWSYVSTADSFDLSIGRDDGRFAAVPGYGIAYTTEQGQSSPDEWCICGAGDDDTDDGTEWAYAIGPNSLTVIELDWRGGPGIVKGVFRYTDPEPDWAALEVEDDD